MQYRFDDGPCLRAARENRTYLIRDFESEERFGEYIRAASGHGLRSALSVPIPLDGNASAALNLYSASTNAFDQNTIEATELLGREASRSLRTAVRIAHLTDKNENMHAAMTSRTVIDMAAGIIMSQNRCSHDAALHILKAASSGRNMKLRDVAAKVVASTGQHVPDPHFDS